MSEKTLDKNNLMPGGAWKLTIGGSNVGSFKSLTIANNFTSFEHKVGYPPATDYSVKNSEDAVLTFVGEEWNIDNLLFFLGAARPESGCTIIHVGGQSELPVLEDIEVELVFPGNERKIVYHFYKGQVVSGGTISFNDDMTDLSTLPFTIKALVDAENNNELYWMYYPES